MNILQGFISILYPNICPGCNNTLPNKENSICILCWSNLPKTYQYKNPENHTIKLFWGRYPLVHAFSTFKYNKKGIIQNIIYDLKYRGNKKVGEDLGKEIGKEILEIELKIDIIIPVPLHPYKLQKRGYNQSHSIALGIQNIIKTPIDTTTLIRTINTDSQTKKSKYDRWKNVKEIFKLTNKNKLANKHILLVDDVITTGSTIEGCCLILDEVNNIKISVVSIASA